MRRRDGAQELPAQVDTTSIWAAAPAVRTTYVAPYPAPRTLPQLPAMLPEEPGEQELTAAALRAVSAAESGDAHTQAAGLALRVATFGAVSIVGAALTWAAGALLWRWAWATLPMLLLCAVLCTGAYLLISEGVSRRFTAAGVERLKVKTAAQIHRDRLQQRERMHRDAVEAWQNVLIEYLRNEERH